MKIWVLEIGEPLPVEKDVRLHRYGQFTQALVEFGHEVTWWTSSFSHAPKQHFFEKSGSYNVNGVKLNVIKGPGYRRNVSIQRIHHQKAFARDFKSWAVMEERPDLIIAPVPTVDVSAAAVEFAQPRNIPVVVDIRDLWPDELVDLAPKPLRPLAHLMLSRSFLKMKRLCTQATGLMGVSQSYLDYGLRFAGRKQGPNDKVFYLGYSAKTIDEAKMQAARSWVQGLGVTRDDFICCFFGTIGNYFQLEPIIECAEQLGLNSPVKFILGGDGSRLQQYKSRARGLANVIFPGWLDGPKIAAVMEIAGAGLAPYASDAKMSLPNKPFEYFAGGLPVISSIQGELKGVLAQENIGFTYSADSSEELLKCITYLLDHPNEREQMGARARKVLEQRFSTEVIFAEIERHLRAVADAHTK